MQNRRTAVIGAITVAALVVSFILAIRAGDGRPVPLIIVVPEGTQVQLEGADRRDLPEQPNTSEGLTSYYFQADAGKRDVTFREPGKPVRIQSIEIPAQRQPVIYTLLRDTLRPMQQTTE